MSVTLTVKNTMNTSLRRIERKMEKLPKEAYQTFKNATPVKTGNAKRNTKLKGNTIQADYAYGGVLDKGRHMTSRGMRGSEQAPEGMTKPTEDFIKKRISEILRGK